MKDAANTAFSFGEFELDSERRLLSKSGEPVNLSSKSFDLLLTLVQNHGQLLTKNDLLDKVWENQFVEENNLTVHIAAIRKALGEKRNENRFIVTVPGKGYRFVADLNRPENGAFRVEKHRFQRIVVNQEEIEEHSDAPVKHETNGDLSVAKKPFPPGTTLFSRKRLAFVSATALIVITALASGYAIRERFAVNAGADEPFQKHTVKQLTTNGKVGVAALSPDGKLFAYTIDDLGKKSLWLGSVDGGNPIELVPPAEATYRSLTFSPDGNELLFSLRDEKNPAPAFLKMPIFGGVQTKLMDNISSFSLSPDGKSLAVARRDKDLEKDFLVIVSLDGRERRDVASFPKEMSFRFDTLSWSPDGKRLAVSAKTNAEIDAYEIAVVEIDSGDITRIQHESLREITKTAWLRDGGGLIITAIEPASNSSVPQYLLYLAAYPGGALYPITSDRSNYGTSWHNDAGVSLSLSNTSDLLLAVEHRQISNVWVAPANDLSAAKQITFSSFGKYDGLWGMDWTPDGRLIYTTSDTKKQFLSRMDSDGSGQKQITPASGYDSVLTVDQSGRYVVFHSNRNSNIDIWRTDIDGSNPLQLTFGGKGFHPAPSPDGKWVYYTSTLYGNARLCRVPIDGGEPEILNDKETWWTSFSPNGLFFAGLYITDKRRLAIFSAETNQVVKQFDLPKTGTMYMGTRWTPDSRAVTYRDTSFGYWNQPIEGGDPYRLEGLPQEKLYNFSWSKDGQSLAFVRGQEIRDVVLFENSLK